MKNEWRKEEHTRKTARRAQELCSLQKRTPDKENPTRSRATGLWSGIHLAPKVPVRVIGWKDQWIEVREVERLPEKGMRKFTMEASISIWAIGLLARRPQRSNAMPLVHIRKRVPKWQHLHNGTYKVGRERQKESPKMFRVWYEEWPYLTVLRDAWRRELRVLHPSTCRRSSETPPTIRKNATATKRRRTKDHWKRHAITTL